MRSRSTLQLRAAALATAATLALGAAACGGSDDDGSSEGNGGGSAEEQARERVEALYAGLRAGDAAMVCEQLTAAGQRQLQQGGRGPKGDSCAETFQRFLDRGGEESGLSLARKAKILSVKVEDDTAVAKISFGGQGSGDVNLEKVDGEWKVSAAGASPSR